MTPATSPTTPTPTCNTWPSRPDSIDQGRPVIFYCRAGIRSGMAAEAFRAAGWDAYNLRGGLLAWGDAVTNSDQAKC
ncbi:rhodanese-like domain-containing protein [Actinopolyspora halophila]|uniref:rhodanese-like domain-containing protein n=1 Tax=Actinopolyspora halophila TaxID=1850 RepID=UPI000A042318|nr:rhodanese-like domain-containing protein [Actinopolyspora halophila]